MKLGFKIFWGILLAAFLTLGATAAQLILGTHADSLQREQERSVSEYEMIAASLDNALATARILDGSTDFEKPVMQRFNRYYQNKGIFLSLAQDGKLRYDSNEQFAFVYPDMLEKVGNDYLISVRPVDTEHYMFVSSALAKEDYTLFYARDISVLYQARAENIRLSVSFGLILVLLVAMVAWLVSRSLTRPLKNLQQSANALADGNRSPLSEGRDEIGLLATSFNRMSDAVQQREQELKLQLEQRQTFIDDLAHEMNTPLASIQGYAALLEQANCSEEQKQKAAAHIQNETRRLKGMHQKLRALSIIREHSLQGEDISVKALFDDVEEQLRPVFSEHHMTLVRNGSVQTVRGDRELLQMLLSNLVRNAVLYSPEGGMVTLCAEEQKGKTCILVTDHGIGIEAKKQQKIFDPFYRVDKSRSRQTGGTGLGLPICKRIADLHGADLSVHSVPGKGTTMKLTLPTVTTS